MFGKKKDGLQMGKAPTEGFAREPESEVPAPRVVQRPEPMTIVQRPSGLEHGRPPGSETPRAMPDSPRLGQPDALRSGAGEMGRPMAPEAPRRMPEPPPMPRRAPEMKPAEPRPSEIRMAEAKSPVDSDKRLIVGCAIIFKDEIRACDRLVIEGHIEASLADSRSMEIGETGSLKGCAQVETADVSGLLEGEITVRGRLTVRSTGRIIGTIRYGQLEIERGGVLIGTMEMISESPVVASAAAAPVRSAGRGVGMEKSAAN